jgi:type I restriction enzyme S subunit
MEVKPGYKQTELGVIPEDWEVALVSSLLAMPIQNGLFNEPSRKGRGCKLVNVIDLYGSFPIDTMGLERFDADPTELLRFGVKHGDIFFTRSSLTPDGIAQCSIYGGDGSETAVFDSHVIRVRANGNRVEPFFLARYCSSRAARRHLVTNAKTTTMTTIDQSVIATLPVALPPLAEQRAIARALRDMDGLLVGLDALIAKKRDLKQATMQQLLTAQTRLPGFHGEWKIVWMRQVLKQNATYGIVTAGTFVRNGVKMLRGGDIVDGRINTDLPMVSREKAAEYNRTALEKNDVVIALVGYPGASARIPDELIDSNISRAVGLLRPNEKASADFLVSFLNSPKGRRMVLAPSAGSAQQVVNLAALNKLQFSLPTIPEQTAIAEVLSDMDAELWALEQRRQKTRDLKQAMMQELLTGKTRLV